jgi:hypothetical protein
MLKTGQVWSGIAVTRDSTGALAAASVGPAGVLYVNGVANAAAVTVSGANPYKWTVTLPALTAGDCVSVYLTATVDMIATASVVAEHVADTYRESDTYAEAALIHAHAATIEADTNELQTDLTDGGRLDLILDSIGTDINAIEAAISGAVGTLSVVSVVNGDDIEVSSHTTWQINLTGLGNISTRTKCYFTVKAAPAGQADTEALLQIEETAGLLRIDGAAPSSALLGSLVVTNQVTGAVTVTVDETLTGLAPRIGYTWEVKTIEVTTGHADRIATGTFAIDASVTRAVT